MSAVGGYAHCGWLCQQLVAMYTVSGYGRRSLLGAMDSLVKIWEMVCLAKYTGSNPLIFPKARSTQPSPPPPPLSLSPSVLFYMNLICRVSSETDLKSIYFRLQSTQNYC